MTLRPMTIRDLTGASKVHGEAFPRQTRSYEWLKCAINAYPRMLCYVATVEDDVGGYIIWTQKSGFRPEAVMELEQLAVRPPLQGQGIGKALIKQSLELVRQQIEACTASC